MKKLKYKTIKAPDGYVLDTSQVYLEKEARSFRIYFKRGGSNE